ncbi:FtsB family cell division protein [Silvibacterium acidisoli]|uniref:FtsB family cell division protein n=1 Tax=Acidobacteriaceae bacterium ZG23-2 TaxID=2883246 RepID=UPI00406D47F3
MSDELKFPTPKQAEKMRPAEYLYNGRRKIATALAVVLAVFFGYHVMFGRNGLTIYEQKRVEDRDLQKRIGELKDENERLQTHVEHLKNDPDAIEREARDRLHYARPGEVIYTLNDKTPAK